MAYCLIYMNRSDPNGSKIWKVRRRIKYIRNQQEIMKGGRNGFLLLRNTKIWWHLGFCPGMIDSNFTCMWMGDKALCVCMGGMIDTVNWKGQQLQVFGSDRQTTEKLNRLIVHILWGNLTSLTLAGACVEHVPTLDVSYIFLKLHLSL